MEINDPAMKNLQNQVLEQSKKDFPLYRCRICLHVPPDHLRGSTWCAKCHGFLPYGKTGQPLLKVDHLRYTCSNCDHTAELQHSLNSCEGCNKEFTLDNLPQIFDRKFRDQHANMKRMRDDPKSNIDLPTTGIDDLDKVVQNIEQQMEQQPEKVKADLMNRIDPEKIGGITWVEGYFTIYRRLFNVFSQNFNPQPVSLELGIFRYFTQNMTTDDPNNELAGLLENFMLGHFSHMFPPNFDHPLFYFHTSITKLLAARGVVSDKLRDILASMDQLPTEFETSVLVLNLVFMANFYDHYGMRALSKDIRQVVTEFLTTYLEDCPLEVTNLEDRSPLSLEDKPKLSRLLAYSVISEVLVRMVNLYDSDIGDEWLSDIWSMLTGITSALNLYLKNMGEGFDSSTGTNPEVNAITIMAALPAEVHRVILLTASNLAQGIAYLLRRPLSPISLKGEALTAGVNDVAVFLQEIPSYVRVWLFTLSGLARPEITEIFYRNPSATNFNIENFHNTVLQGISRFNELFNLFQGIIEARVQVGYLLQASAQIQVLTNFAKQSQNQQLMAQIQQYQGQVLNINSRGINPITIEKKVVELNVRLSGKTIEFEKFMFTDDSLMSLEPFVFDRLFDDPQLKILTDHIPRFPVESGLPIEAINKKSITDLVTADGDKIRILEIGPSKTNKEYGNVYLFFVKAEFELQSNTTGSKVNPWILIAKNTTYEQKDRAFHNPHMIYISLTLQSNPLDFEYIKEYRVDGHIKPVWEDRKKLFGLF